MRVLAAHAVGFARGAATLRPRRRAGSDPAAVRRGSGVFARSLRPRPVLEIGLLISVYVGYSITRTLVDGQTDRAVATGLAILHLESAMGIDVESPAVRWVVQATPLAVGLAYLYATLHYVVTPLVLVWLYRVHPELYRSARRLLLAATVAALAWFAAMPTAPPRLLPAGYPDVLARTADWGWWGSAGSAPQGLGSLTNQYAAMPSMHVGWALWAGSTVALLHHHRAVRSAAVAYPVLMTVVVVTTANHYVLDALAGAAVVVVAATLPALHRRRRQASEPVGSGASPRAVRRAASSRMIVTPYREMMHPSLRRWLSTRVTDWRRAPSRCAIVSWLRWTSGRPSSPGSAISSNR
jgi:hypothetical protein